jgi:hypothetical protein
MRKVCKEPTCNYPVFGGGFCFRHQHLRPDKKKTTIRPFSVKREKINRKEYTPKARAFVKDNPICEIKSPECQIEAVCVHHLKGKASIELLLDDRLNISSRHAFPAICGWSFMMPKAEKWD